MLMIESENFLCYFFGTFFSCAMNRIFSSIRPPNYSIIVVMVIIPIIASCSNSDNLVVVHIPRSKPFVSMGRSKSKCHGRDISDISQENLQDQQSAQLGWCLAWVDMDSNGIWRKHVMTSKELIYPIIMIYKT